MAVWPTSLPDISLALTETRQDAAVRTPMDAGPMKMRRRFSAASRYVAGSVILDNTQRATFDTFFETTIEEGSLPFDMDDPRDGTTQEWRFTAPPSFVARKGNGSNVVTLWVATLALEILP